jgi:hypothetical protein
MTALPVLHNANPGYVSELDNMLREIGINKPEDQDQRYQQAMTAFAIAARDKSNAEYIVDKLLSSFFFKIQDKQDRFGKRDKHHEDWQRMKAEHPEDWGERVDATEFLPQDIYRALPKLDNLAPELQAILSAAAKNVLKRLSVEKLANILLCADTPGWLCKAILCNKRFIDLLSGVVNIPVNIRQGLYDDTAQDDAQKTAEMQKTLEQAGKAIEWLSKCPPEFLPVNIDPFPPDLLDYAAIRAGQLTQNLPPDKLLALASLNIFPAWLRLAAEKRFTAITSSTAGISTRRRKPKRSEN